MGETTAGLGEALATRTETDLERPAHVVQFYEDDAPLVDAIARFVGAGLGAGDAVVVIATERHRAGVEDLLRARGLDLAGARAGERYVALDAAETLATFMQDGWPDHARFREVVGGTIEAAMAVRPRVRAFGDLVSLLWADGRRAAAIRVEQLWNELAATRAFGVLCAYPMTGFTGEADEGPFLAICGEHSHVVPTESYAEGDTLEDRGRAIARLQQRAIALETEVQPRLAAIVESSDDAIVGKTLEGIVTSWNRGAERIFGYTADEMIGRSIAAIIPPERRDDLRRILDAIRRGERVDHFETERIRKDGERLTLSVTVSPIRDASGRIIGASKIARDVTERKRIEQERQRLLAAERKARHDAEAASRAKDEFLATVSHELRTPLSPILTWIRMLKAGALDAEKARRALESIERSARTQAQLVEDLLDISRITSGKLRLDVRPVRLAAVIDAAIEVVRPAADARGVELAIELDRDVGPVSGDAERLQQVVWNLVSNAIKFTPRGGRVVVRVAPADRHVELSVQDDGVGITREFLPHVFERFRQGDSSSTRHHGGLGLGLALVRHLVELHGGTVRASSPGRDQGSTFTVKLPVMSVVRPPAPVPSSRLPDTAIHQSAPGSLAGVSVLLVDDEADARELFTTLLEQSGARVTAVSSGAEALAALAESPPDVLVSDIEMPEESGYDLIRRLRNLPPERGGRIPAVALTAYARSEDRMRALRAGFQIHVSKPVLPAELVAVVSSQVRRG